MKKYKKRLKELEQIVNELQIAVSLNKTETQGVEFIKSDNKEIRESGWYKYKDSKYLMHHDYKNGIKYGFAQNGIWFDNNIPIHISKAHYEFTKASHEEVEQRLIEEAKNRGFKQGVYLDRTNIKNLSNTFIKNDYPEEIGLIKIYETEEDGVFLEFDGYVVMENGNWAEVSHDKLQYGDVVKAWDEDESDNFVYGILEQKSKNYLVSGNWFKNIEPAPEEVSKHFKS